VSPDGYASLYLARDPLNPGSSLTLETISVVRGAEVPTSYNADGSVATFTRTDSLTCDNGGSVAPIWTGLATQNFVRSTYRCCSRYFCRTCTRITNVGASGTITATSQSQSGAAAVTVTPEAEGPADVKAAVALPRARLKIATH